MHNPTDVLAGAVFGAAVAVAVVFAARAIMARGGRPRGKHARL